jgi:hypothetical protein
MQIHLHEVKILQIHNARPEFVKKISQLLTNQNPAFLYSAFYVTIVFAVFTLHRDACRKICETLSVVRFM